MKKDLHPNLLNTKVVCASCGTEYDIMSDKESLRIEVCKNCHPFYTGKQRVGGADGRIERFKNKYNLNK